MRDTPSSGIMLAQDLGRFIVINSSTVVASRVKSFYLDEKIVHFMMYGDVCVWQIMAVDMCCGECRENCVADQRQ